MMAVGYFLLLAVRDVARGFRTGAAAAWVVAQSVQQ